MTKFNKLKKAFRKFLKNEEGWTILETVIVVGIILFLTGTVGFYIVGYFSDAKVASAKSTISSLEEALTVYSIDCGMFPTEEQGLNALIEQPILEPVPEGWDGIYLTKTEVPLDPWGREYVYMVPGPKGLAFGIITYGADGMEGGEDENADIASWKN